MKAMTRQCPVKGCKVKISGSLLMCKAHWIACPGKLRSEVWRWYKSGQENRNDASQMYREAAAAAIAQAERDESDQLLAGVQLPLL